jgi:cbb3-type cytochrome oxidase subunit 3
MLDQLVNILRPIWIMWAMAIFCGVVLWVYVLTPKATVEAHGAIPLRDDDSEER